MKIISPFDILVLHNEDLTKGKTCVVLPHRIGHELVMLGEWDQAVRSEGLCIEGKNTCLDYLPHEIKDIVVKEHPDKKYYEWEVHWSKVD